MRQVCAVLVFGLIGCFGFQGDTLASRVPGGYSATLVLNTKDFSVDPKQVEGLKPKKGQRHLMSLPKTSKIDATLTITNTFSDKDLKFNIGGDMSQIILRLEGPGAVTKNSMMAMTMDFRMGKDKMLKPGESHTFKIGSMSHGKRGISTNSYWTKPGEYTLTAVYKMGQVEIVSNPVKFTVK